MLPVTRGMHLDSSYLFLLLTDARSILFDFLINTTQEEGQIEACGIEWQESALNGDGRWWMGRSFGPVSELTAG
jgi:hypothetical protein